VWERGGPQRASTYAVDQLVFRNNLVYHNDYGWMDADGNGFAQDCLDYNVNTSVTFDRNVLADRHNAAHTYPGTNYFPSSASLANDFQDTTNYYLKPTSAYHNAGTDGQDLGWLESETGGGPPTLSSVTLSLGQGALTASGGAAGQVVYDSSGGQVSGSTTGTTASFPITVGTQANRAVYAMVCLDNAGGDAFATATYDGNAMTVIASAVTHQYTALFRYLGPASGTKTIAMSWEGDVRFVVGAVALYNVHPTTPNTTPMTTEGASGSSSSLGVTGSAVGDLVLDVINVNNNTSAQLTVGASQTKRVNTSQTTVDATVGEMSTEAGAATTVTMSWSWSGTVSRYAQIATSIKSAPSQSQSAALTGQAMALSQGTLTRGGSTTTFPISHQLLRQYRRGDIR
jgi:hypothetical protein